MLEERTRHQGDVPERGPAEVGDHRPSRIAQGLGLGAERLQLGRGDGPELLQVVGRVELLLIDRLLADDRVEEPAALGHPSAGRDCRVAAGVDQQIAIGRGGGVEIARHQHFQPLLGTPGLPALGREAEHRVARADPIHIHSERRLQVRLDQSQHLVGLVDFDRPPFQPEMLAQGGHPADMHPGDRGRAEIHRHPGRLAVGQRRPDDLSAGHALVTPLLKRFPRDA